MAKFGGLTLTQGGRTLLGKALAGKELKFTYVMSGDGFLPDEQEIYDLTGMINPIRDLPIHSAEPTGVGTATIQAIMNNADLTTGYFVREIGLFALDPDDETEILYAYCNAGDKADFMPAPDGPDVVEYLISLVAVIDQAQNVTAVVNGGLVYVTHEELENRLKNIFPTNNDGVNPSEIDAIWARLNNEDRVLRPIQINMIKHAILGSEDYDLIYLLNGLAGQYKYH
jgi:hypothetical protein